MSRKFLIISIHSIHSIFFPAVFKISLSNLFILSETYENSINFFLLLFLSLCLSVNIVRCSEVDLFSICLLHVISFFNFDAFVLSQFLRRWPFSLSSLSLLSHAYSFSFSLPICTLFPSVFLIFSLSFFLVFPSHFSFSFLNFITSLFLSLLSRSLTSSSACFLSFHSHFSLSLFFHLLSLSHFLIPQPCFPEFFLALPNSLVSS